MKVPGDPRCPVGMEDLRLAPCSGQMPDPACLLEVSKLGNCVNSPKCSGTIPSRRTSPGDNYSPVSRCGLHHFRGGRTGRAFGAPMGCGVHPEGSAHPPQREARSCLHPGFLHTSPRRQPEHGLQGDLPRPPRSVIFKPWVQDPLVESNQHLETK